MGKKAKYKVSPKGYEVNLGFYFISVAPTPERKYKVSRGGYMVRGGWGLYGFLEFILIIK